MVIDIYKSSEQIKVWTEAIHKMMLVEGELMEVDETIEGK